MAPKLQVALDFVDLHRALKVAQECVAGGADWLEVGTPLIKSEGLNAVRRLREEFPQAYIVADMKTMDAGRAEMEIAAKAGANAAVVLGVACDSTIQECVEAGRNYGIEVGVDLLGVEDVVRRARQAEEWGVAHVGIHTAIDEQMRGLDPFEKLRAIRKAVSIPISVAGGVNSETVADAVEAGADIVIVGGAITKAADAKRATEEIKRAIATRTRIKTELFKRVGAEQV
ncbi:MAG: bifunctional hexulose-6-phosphate synthase/ribonuclease regulator, partial [Planctomycetes bacterium]|nr:bifunctional hexulose-6-phosphate synthase/ribonuclease regulator [Planctomycetota bacterium]